MSVILGCIRGGGGDTGSIESTSMRTFDSSAVNADIVDVLAGLRNGQPLSGLSIDVAYGALHAQRPGRRESDLTSCYSHLRQSVAAIS